MPDVLIFSLFKTLKDSLFYFANYFYDSNDY